MKKRSRKPTVTQIQAAKDAARREYERFMALSDEEKTRDAEATARMRSRPLSPAERAMFDEIGIGRRGRPPRGAGAKQISVTVERDLLRRVDDFAHQSGVTRAELVARGLDMVLQKAG